MRKGMLLSLVATLVIALLENALPVRSTALPPVQRVNAPYYNGTIKYWTTGLFWFGRISPTENYIDTRVGYNDQELYINFAVFDRLLWYDANHNAGTLTAYDALTVYLDTAGGAANAPTSTSFRLDAQMSHDWDTPRSAWQAASRGNGSSWITAAVPFTTTAYIKYETDTIGGTNNNQNNRGYVVTYHIPFTSLGLSGPPAPGTIWALGVKNHDRDDAAGTVISDKVWPENWDATNPASWGQLRFGQLTYSPPPTTAQSTTTIRQGLNGAVVPDAAVGGDFNCGDGLDTWTQWGNKNYSGEPDFNVQNQDDLSDWPCFSKYFVTFPLGAVPSGKTIVSATLTLYQFGNAGCYLQDGCNPGPVPSYLQVFTINQDWNENTLTWNDAPQARENIAGMWVAPLNAYPGYPGGISRTWDVSRAVAEAYSAGESLRLAIYSADSEIHSGRYFYSSNVEDYNAQGRPTLKVIWSQTDSNLGYSASPPNPRYGQRVTYTLSTIAGGSALTLTSSLPLQVSAPGPVVVMGGGTAAYNSGSRQVIWTGTSAAGTPIAITFPVTVVVTSPMLLRSTATLADASGGITQATADVLANAYQVRLPLVWRP
jgi:hypothetical protein